MTKIIAFADISQRRPAIGIAKKTYFSIFINIAFHEKTPFIPFPFSFAVYS